MFLFALLSNVLLYGEASNYISSLGSVNFTESDTNNASSNPNPILSNDETNISLQNPPKMKRKRNPPGKPDPNSEVLALSPETLLATNRFVCGICQKGFQRDQNLQLHMRGHNINRELKRRSPGDSRKKVYICPEPTCVHHHPSRALGDLTGIKKHFSRKHGEKTWKCEKCPKVYAVQSDWKAHSKTCGTREYQCDCGTIFSRKDSYVAHREFCAALAQESARISASTQTQQAPLLPAQDPFFSFSSPSNHHCYLFSPNPNPMGWDPLTTNPNPLQIPETLPAYNYPASPLRAHLSATTLLQKAASVSSHSMGHMGSSMEGSQISSHFVGRFGQEELTTWHKGEHLTRDFMGLTREDRGNVRNGTMYDANVRNGTMYDHNVGLREVLTFNRTAHHGHGLPMMKGGRGEEFVFGADPFWK